MQIKKIPAKSTKKVRTNNKYEMIKIMKKLIDLPLQILELMSHNIIYLDQFCLKMKILLHKKIKIT